jgi:hypothetical protein
MEISYVFVALFVVSTQAVDLKMQPKPCIRKEIMLALVSNNKKLSQKLSIIENDFSLIKNKLVNQMENIRSLGDMYLRPANDLFHNVPSVRTEEARNTERSYNTMRYSSESFFKKAGYKRGIVQRNST